MQRLVKENSWYGWSSLTLDWGAINFAGFVESSMGNIPLDPTYGNPLYLVGARYDKTGKFLMGGQSQNGFGTIFYTDGKWWQLDSRSFGVSPCAFSQDGRFFYGVVDATTAIVRDNETGVLSFVNANFFTDGIRAVIPPDNKIILGNTTNYSPEFDLFQYIDFGNGLAVGQGADGLVCWFNGTRYLVEPGGTYFIRAMFDGFNIALATVKQTELAEVNWFLNINELVTFPIAGSEPIEVIGRRMFSGWIEHSEPTNQTLVPSYANNLMRVHDKGSIRLVSNGQFIYQWVQGSTVEEIEVQCLNNPSPCFAYWDARMWPRWPNLKPNDILGLQAYCLKEETPHIFEMNQQAVIDAVPAHYNLGWVPQCFTSNDGLTKNLKGLVPVYSRLAKKNTRIQFNLMFCDTRGTGLQDHPEVLPLWQEFHAGITGVPMADNGVVDGVLVDPRAYHFSLVEGLVLDGTDATLAHHLENLKDKWYKYGFGMQHGSGCNPRPRLYFPTAICPNAAPNMANPNEVCLGVKQDPKCWDELGRRADITNHPPTQWTWDEAGPQEYQPITPVTPPNPGEMAILIFGFTNPTRRSDPLGCHITLEVGSDRPVVRIRINMPGSGMEEKVIEFPVLPGNDGRFWRGFNIKLTHEGTWDLQITAEDDAGNSVTVNAGRVTVIP